MILSLLVMASISLGKIPIGSSDYHRWASSPPMGWNSWDSFGTTLDELHAKSQADAMARLLKPYGWRFFTVDIQWYEPSSQGHGYRAGAALAMDPLSRLVPATTKFPSAANDAGFRPLADYVHAKGLKFGIHILRGIPRQAVKQNSPILGTTARAADIADTSSVCGWNSDMYGVDLSKRGAQAYYDSLFSMYASWGVDFVKVDDISRPYDPVQRAEIEAIRRAIDKTGRPIVLSLSPGDTPLEQGDHVSHHANMWRISDDFWDRWEPLHGMFDRLERWTKFRQSGAWPDADMLPFGTVEFGRPTRFTQDEETLCMTLWSIARSPLILGADMTKLDAFTLGLLTNKEVLEVSQHSANNRQVSRKDDLIVWTADVPHSPDKFVALFNAQSVGPATDLPNNSAKATLVSVALHDIGLNGHVRVRDLWVAKNLGEFQNSFSQSLRTHCAGLYRISPVGRQPRRFPVRNFPMRNLALKQRITHGRKLERSHSLAQATLGSWGLWHLTDSHARRMR